jgi:hypothetical protein
MIVITNISRGNVMLDSMAVALSSGQQLELDGTWIENVVQYPELSLFLGRGRISVTDTSLNGSNEDEH